MDLTMRRASIIAAVLLALVADLPVSAAGSQPATAVTALMKDHFSAVTERDDARRRELFRRTYAREVVFYEPAEVARGQRELEAMFGRLRKRFPKAVFTMPAPIDVHDGAARVKWQLGNPGEAPFGSGEDFVLLREGKILALYNFFDSV
jgi:hypothetical protein